MNLKFWQKNKENVASVSSGDVKLPGPKNMPESVGRHLVVRFGKDPDWVWNLKSVSRPRPGEKSAFDVRIFEERQVAEKIVNVKNYMSLDAHPELILFEGWYDKKTMKVQIGAKEAPIPRAA